MAAPDPQESAAALPSRLQEGGRRRRRTLVVVLSLLASLVALEAFQRVILFADGLAGTALAGFFRRAELYASPDSEDYWKLNALFRKPRAMAQAHPDFDERLGWLSKEIDPVTLAHVDEARLGERRPVLLFGDSYAQCVDRAGDCWQALLESSELAQRYGLLNYGVGGYGFDQAYLLSRLVLERFRERDPVVVMAILVDDDLDRSCLRLRPFPKPWFTLEGERLVEHPPAARTPLAFVQAQPPGIWSYAWRLLGHGSGLVQGEMSPSLREREALCRGILCALQEEYDGLDSFVLLFHGRRSASAPGPSGWQEPFLHRLFEERRLPFVSSKRWLRAHARETGASLDDYYFLSGGGLNHYNELGNRVVFEALRQGLLGSFEPYVYLEEDEGRR